MKSIALAVSLTVLALAGCTGGGGSSSSVNTAYSLTEADFAVASTRSLSTSDVESRVNDDGVFEWEGVDSGQTVQPDSCIGNKFANFTFSRAGADTYRIFLSDIDLKDCYQESSSGWIIESSVISVYMDDVMYKDESGYPVDLEGKDYDSVGTLLPSQYRLRAYSLNRFRNSDTDETLEFRRIEMIHHVSSMSVPCTFNGILDGCRIEGVYRATSSDPALNSYVDKDIFDTHNLGIVDHAPYFQNGTITFTYNDWTGTMTYGNDAYTAPTYEATNGVETVSGTYTPPSPALPRSFLGVPMLPFPKID